MSTTVSGVETEKEVPPPPRPPTSRCKGSAYDAFLRVVLLAASVAAVVVMVTSKETKIFQVPVPGTGIFVPVSKPAKFNYSPAFIYFVVALSVAGLYSIITGLVSLSKAGKPSISAKWLLFLIIYDVLILGIVASATGTAGGVAYIGLKGNSHVGWAKICNSYGKYCRHIGGSLAVGLVASFVLVMLIIFNSYSLYRAVEPRN